MSGEPQITRQSTTDLEALVQAKEVEIAHLHGRLEERTSEKRKSPEPDETEEGAADDTEEKADEPPAKKQKTEAPADEDGDSDFTDNEDDDAEMEDVIADGTHVAVAYGHLDGLSKRKWYAAIVKGYNAENKLYTVDWKYPPRSWAKKTFFKCDSSRLRLIEEEDFKTAPKRGTGYVGLHRASTFIMPERELASDEESVDDEEGLAVGDYVAVAYGAARANKRGTDVSAKAADPAKYKKRLLWYAATIVEDLGEQFKVEWKHPYSKKESAMFFIADKEKVQAITTKEFKKSRRRAKGKTSYGLVGVHRLATKAALTSG